MVFKGWYISAISAFCCNFLLCQLEKVTCERTGGTSGRQELGTTLNKGCIYEACPEKSTVICLDLISVWPYYGSSCGSRGCLKLWTFCRTHRIDGVSPQSGFFGGCWGWKRSRNLCYKYHRRVASHQCGSWKKRIDFWLKQINPMDIYNT